MLWGNYKHLCRCCIMGNGSVFPYGKLASSTLCFHLLRTKLLWFESNVVFLLHQYTYSAICSSLLLEQAKICVCVCTLPYSIHPVLYTLHGVLTYSLVFSQVPKLIDALVPPYYCVYCVLESLAPNRTLLKQEHAYWIETLLSHPTWHVSS